MKSTQESGNYVRPLRVVFGRGTRADRRLEAAEGLPRRELPRRLLRQVAQPLTRLVLDGGLRQPREGAQLPRASRSRLGRERQVVGPGRWQRRRIALEEPVDEERECGRSAGRRDEEDDVEKQHVRHISSLAAQP